MEGIQRRRRPPSPRRRSSGARDRPRKGGGNPRPSPQGRVGTAAGSCRGQGRPLSCRRRSRLRRRPRLHADVPPASRTGCPPRRHPRLPRRRRATGRGVERGPGGGRCVGRICPIEDDLHHPAVGVAGGQEHPDIPRGIRGRIHHDADLALPHQEVVLVAAPERVIVGDLLVGDAIGRVVVGEPEASAARGSAFPSAPCVAGSVHLSRG